ncbi:hypothetical protein, partial [Microbacterium sp. K41]|uniref:hypothetical protein n=1 Tax=Microbacterium sp. K41 TaxID=2305437 RepID=UPI0014446EB8
LSRLDAEEPRIAEARVELGNARAAEALRPTIAAAARAREALAEAVAGESRAAEEWTAYGIEVDDLEAWVTERLREIGGWERAVVLERHATERDAEQRA